MADKVIHGEGKPRIVISTPVLHSDTVASATSTSVTLTTGADLANLETTYGLTNRLVFSLSGADDNVTYGKISGYSESPDVLQVTSWSNGTPNALAIVEIKDVQLDLPYCQALVETFSPDTLVKKMFSGEIRLRKRGFYYQALLDYSGYIHKDELSLLRHLFRVDTQSMIFYPRVDNLSIAYSVNISPDAEIEFRQIQKHQGHRGVQVLLVGLERLSEAKVYDLVSQSGYGVNYGTNYGAN